MGQGKAAAGVAEATPASSTSLMNTAPAPAPDPPVRPTPSLRLLASEPDLASLPRTALPETASQARAAPQESARPKETPRNDEANEGESLAFDHIRERIASLPAAPEIALSMPRASVPSSPRSRSITSFANRAEAVLNGMNLPGWWRGAAAGLLALVAAGLAWHLGRRRRARLMEEEAPIQWGPPDESEAALRATLLAKRDAAAQGRSAPRLSRGYATLGEALIAMKTAAAKPTPRPAAQDQPRVDA